MTSAWYCVVHLCTSNDTNNTKQVRGEDVTAKESHETNVRHSLKEAKALLYQHHVHGVSPAKPVRSRARPLIKYRDLHNLFRSGHKSLLARVAYLECWFSEISIAASRRALALSFYRYSRAPSGKEIPHPGGGCCCCCRCKTARKCELQNCSRTVEGHLQDIFLNPAIIRTRYFPRAFALKCECK